MKPCEKILVLFLLKHLLSGVAGAVVLATGLLVFDVANLATLMWASEQGFIAAILLYSGLSATFGGAAMGIGVMALGEDTRP